MKRRSTFSAHSLKSTRETRYCNWRAAISMQNLAESSKLRHVITPPAHCWSRMRSAGPGYRIWCAHRSQRSAQNKRIAVRSHKWTICNGYPYPRLRLALRMRIDLVPVQVISMKSCPSPEIRGKVRPHRGVDNGWAAFPESQLRLGQRAARIWHLTPKVSWRHGLPRSRRQIGPGTAGVVRNDEGVSMKRSWTALAVALEAIFAGAGCNDYGNTFQNNTGASISFLSPAQISAGNADFVMTVNGGGFVTKTVVQWNGKPLKTTPTLDSAGNILNETATVPAALVAKPGVATVITLNPATGAGNNGLSNPVAFIINPPPNPLPGLTGTSPASAPASSAPFTLMLNGSNFLPTTDPSGGSQVNWSIGGTQRKLTVLSGTSSNQIQATVTADLLVNPGTTNLTASVTVFNPPSPPPPGCITVCSGGGGGGSSAPATLSLFPSSWGCPAPATG